MDNIQLCYIDNEINKIDKMKQGDVIYKNGVELLVVLRSPCYNISDNRSPEEKHEEEMRFCKDLNDLRCEMLIDMAKKIEEYLS